MLEFLSRETSNWISGSRAVNGDGSVSTPHTTYPLKRLQRIVQIADLGYTTFHLDSDGVLWEEMFSVLRETIIAAKIVSIVRCHRIIYALSDRGQVWRREYSSLSFSILPLEELVLSMVAHEEDSISFTTHSSYIYSRRLNLPVRKWDKADSLTLTAIVARDSYIKVNLIDDDIVVKGVTIRKNVIDMAACKDRLAVVDKEGNVFESKDRYNDFVFTAVKVPFPVHRIGYFGTETMVVKSKKGKIMVL